MNQNHAKLASVVLLVVIVGAFAYVTLRSPIFKPGDRVPNAPALMSQLVNIDSRLVGLKEKATKAPERFSKSNLNVAVVIAYKECDSLLHSPEGMPAKLQADCGLASSLFAKM